MKPVDKYGNVIDVEDWLVSSDNRRFLEVIGMDEEEEVIWVRPYYLEGRILRPILGEVKSLSFDYLRSEICPYERLLYTFKELGIKIELEDED